MKYTSPTKKNEEIKSIKPNSTMVSNLFLDHQYLYSGNQVKIFMFISRKTNGWHKETHTCSISYIQMGTGIFSRPTVVKNTKKLLLDGWIKRVSVRGNNGNSYAYSLCDDININKVTSLNIKLVQKLNWFKNYTSTSLKIKPHEVQKLNPLKETSLKKQFKETIYVDLKEIITFWNNERNTNYKPIDSLIDNFSYWKDIYAIGEIETAIKNIKYDSFWNDKMNPTMFFRKQNPRKESVDYIGQFLNATKKPYIQSTKPKEKSPEDKERANFIQDQIDKARKESENAKHFRGAEELAKKFSSK